MSICMIGGRGGYHLEREPIKKDDSGLTSQGSLSWSLAPDKRKDTRKQLWKTKPSVGNTRKTKDVGGKPPVQTGKFRGNRPTVARCGSPQHRATVASDSSKLEGQVINH